MCNLSTNRLEQPRWLVSPLCGLVRAVCAALLRRRMSLARFPPRLVVCGLPRDPHAPPVILRPCLVLRTWLLLLLRRLLLRMLAARVMMSARRLRLPPPCRRWCGAVRVCSVMPWFVCRRHLGGGGEVALLAAAAVVL